MSDEATQVETNTPASSNEAGVSPVLEPASAAKPVLVPLQKTIHLPISDVDLEIYKLKAGPYYDAQIAFAEWLNQVQDVIATSKLTEKELLGKDGQPDLVKAGRAMSGRMTPESAEVISTSSKKALGLRLKFIGIGVGLTPEDLVTKYYAEDIDLISDTLIELNGFMDNLKKSVAPTDQ